VAELVDTIVGDLERPREVPERLSDHIWSTYEIDRDSVGEFLETKLQDLEDYEQELILAPMFTPTLKDQALFAELLGTESVPREEWPALVQQLLDRPARAQLVTNDGEHHAVNLVDVVLERYVSLLRLDGSIADTLWQAIEREPIAADPPMLKAIARRAIWEKDDRCNILVTYLAAAERDGLYHAGDELRLLRLAENFKPTDVASLRERVPMLQEGLRKDIEGGDNPRPFFNEKVKADHGFERDQRHGDADRLNEKKDQFAFLDRLQQALTV
jgi:hypothetical protein